MKEQVKLKVGRFLIPTILHTENGCIFVKFRYNKGLIAEIKAMRGNRYHGFDEINPQKIWSIEDCPRNQFQLAYLKGEKPYAHFDQPIVEHDYDRPLYLHQKECSDFILVRRHCVIAGEIGVGKTLAAIEVTERSRYNNWWYVGPKSAIRAVRRELRIWKSKIQPRMMTYEALVKWMKESEGANVKAPMGVIFDESARLKNPTAQRSQAAMILADGIRADWGYKGFIILMSGAPAPKSPADWWNQCEIACPGFLKEGTQMKFKKRLAIVVQKETLAAGSYPSLEAWLDDTNKCAVCGKFENDTIHDAQWCEANSENDDYHTFQKSKNEVALLPKRMEGLVLIKLKRDCLDLPPMHFRRIHLKPTQKILNLARSLLKTAKTTISGITLLRELSDGFQYFQEKIGEEDCPICAGSGEMQNPISEDHEIISCDGCGGKKKRPVFKRSTTQIESPKAEILVDILDEHLDVGRIVIYAGFTGAIDRCVQTCQKVGWEVIRADGRGWWNSTGTDVDPLDLFQDLQEKYPRVAFVGQPGAAGEGITLTASPTILYYSNTFDGNHRVQSMGRGHRPGMDLVRGLTIIDLIHLPTDELVLDNLTKKLNLQALTMGNLTQALEEENVDAT